MNGSFDRFVDRAYVTTMLIVLALFASMLACPAKGAEKQAARRLEQVKWDVLTHTLTAVVSEGRIEFQCAKYDGNGVRHEGAPCGPQDSGKYVAERISDYDIHLESGTVTLNGESENFATYEGELVWRIVDLLVKYASESVLWFDSEHKRPEVPKLEVSR